MSEPRAPKGLPTGSDAAPHRRGVPSRNVSGAYDRSLSAMRTTKLTGALKYVTIGLIGLTLGLGAGALVGRGSNE